MTDNTEPVNAVNETAVSDTLQEEASTYAPQKLIPFSISIEEAIESCKKYYAGRWLLPKIFTNAVHIEEMQEGFVPYLLHSGSAFGSIVYDAQDSKPQDGPGDIVKQIENYTVKREGTIKFDRIPIIAPGQIPESFMRRIEPFDFDELSPIDQFQDADEVEGLAGAEVADSPEDLKVRVSELVSTLFRDTVDHNYVMEMEKKVDITEDNVECILLPIFILVTRWGRKNYHFAVNGQTGEVTGDLPVHRGKLLAAFMGCFAGGTLAIYAVIRVLMIFLGLFMTVSIQTRTALLVSILGSTFITNYFINNLYDQMRVRRKKVDKSKLPARLYKLHVKQDKMLSCQHVNKRNAVIEEEVYEGGKAVKPVANKK